MYFIFSAAVPSNHLSKEVDLPNTSAYFDLSERTRAVLTHVHVMNYRVILVMARVTQYL